MKRFGLMTAVAALALPLGSAANAQEIFGVVPNDFANTTGTATFLGPFANSQRTYQLLIHENQLNDFVGLPLNGLTWRLPASAVANWPASTTTYNNFDIYLSESVAPANRSLTFADNIVGSQTQVRSGSLAIGADSFTFGSSPNDFGVVIDFDQWLYTGGHLLVEIRHSGSDGASRSVDAIGTAHPGYLNDFSAAWTGNYMGTSGSQGNFSVIQLRAIPAPGSIALLGIALAAASRRRRA